jgi:hypothetical protein
MKKLVFGFAFAAAAWAGSWSGTLVDVMCKDKDIAGHTRKCALGCAKSGFGVVTADGKFLKLDEAGNAKALAALKASTKDKDLKVAVEGEMDGDIIKVSSLELK